MKFLEINPTSEDYWRAIILFGRNVACYKFALAKALLEIAREGKTEIKLENLAIPYGMQIVRHLQISDKQTTSRSSQFLDICRQFNLGQIDQALLIDATVRLGFENVIDAFHNLPTGEINQPFFDQSQWKIKKRIILTDDLLKLVEKQELGNLEREIEARWRLVETSWLLSVNRRIIEHDPLDGKLFTLGNYNIDSSSKRRINITSCRHAIDGYQKGKCFYCFTPVSIVDNSDNLADVDHFFPRSLNDYIEGIDGVWNLVLSCHKCNRGENGKFDRLPNLKYLERLQVRNEFLIDSHHPLRETLIAQTGTNKMCRQRFLQNNYNEVQRLLGVATGKGWKPSIEYPIAF